MYGLGDVIEWGLFGRRRYMGGRMFMGRRRQTSPFVDEGEHHTVSRFALPHWWINACTIAAYPSQEMTDLYYS